MLGAGGRYPGPGLNCPPSDMVPGYPTASPATDVWWSSLETWQNLFSWGPNTPKLVLTPSGGYQNVHGWKAGGMHPTGMLSCYHPQEIMFSHLSVILSTGGCLARYPPRQTPPKTATAADGTHHTGMHSCYHPQRSCGKVMFLHVCHSVNMKGGVSVLEGLCLGDCPVL